MQYLFLFTNADFDILQKCAFQLLAEIDDSREMCSETEDSIVVMDFLAALVITSSAKFKTKWNVLFRYYMEFTSPSRGEDFPNAV